MSKVLLLKTFGKLGKMGDTVTVKDGYARNFLVPSKIAVYSNKSMIEKFKSYFDELKSQEKIQLENAELLAEKLKDCSIFIKKRSFPDGRLYGSISTKQISDSVREIVKSSSFFSDISFDLDDFINPSKVILKNLIKTTGSFSCEINLYGEINLNINILVESEDSLSLKKNN